MYVHYVQVHNLYPTLPLLANLRCGLWYTPKPDATCYFKSTDGHAGNWSFSCTRLNLHAADIAARKGGAIIVDATRKGKRYPVRDPPRPCPLPPRLPRRTRAATSSRPQCPAVV
jgi:hypothetical protein